MKSKILIKIIFFNKKILVKEIKIKNHKKEEFRQFV